MSVRVSRFFIDSDLVANSDITISDEKAHYIRNVLRLKDGDLLSLFNGKGGEYSGEIITVGKKSVAVRLGKFQAVDRTPQAAVQLGLCILKRDAMDLTLQKATELGVSSIQLIISERITVSHKQIQNRLAHWQAILISSCEQCGLNILPVLHKPMLLDEWCHSAKGLKLIADPNANASSEKIAEHDAVSVLVGPEGGFTQEEVSTAYSVGFEGIFLGERILRAETAAISLLAVVNQGLLKSH